MTTPPADRLHAAATKLRTMMAAIQAPLPEQTWHTEPCADEARGDCRCIVAQGRYAEGAAPPVPVFYVADAETPELAAWIALMGPVVGEALAAWLDIEAARWDPEADIQAWDASHERALAVAVAILGPEATS